MKHIDNQIAKHELNQAIADLAIPVCALQYYNTVQPEKAHCKSIEYHALIHASTVLGSESNSLSLPKPLPEHFCSIGKVTCKFVMFAVLTKSPNK